MKKSEAFNFMQTDNKELKSHNKTDTIDFHFFLLSILIIQNNLLLLAIGENVEKINMPRPFTKKMNKFASGLARIISDLTRRISLIEATKQSLRVLYI